MLAPFNDLSSQRRAETERALLEGVAGGCVVPLAGFCIEEGDRLYLRARLGRPDGSLMLSAEGRAPLGETRALGLRVAEELLAQGGAEIVTAAKSGGYRPNQAPQN
jgi:hydroxymethylbilane synthase